MADLDLVGALANLKTTLAGLTTWVDLCALVDSQAASLRIYEGGTEESDETLAPCIFIDFTSLPTNWIGGKFSGSLAFEIRCEFPIPEDNRATYSDEFVYAWGVLSDMMADINGAVNGAGQLMPDSLSVSTPPRRIATEDNSQRIEWAFILNLSIKFR